MSTKSGRQKTLAERAALTNRRCLGPCGKIFQSEGIHNRMCHNCKKGEGAIRGISASKFAHSNAVSKKSSYT